MLLKWHVCENISIMPYRSVTFAPGEHYHICFRGNNKQDIFRSDSDRARLLFLILHFQSPENIVNIGRIVTAYSHKKCFEIDKNVLSDIIHKRYVALEAFAFMPNHVHLAIREEQENGTVRYLQRVLNAYAKYFNTKYETVGHLFQGPFRAIHIDDNDQLLYLSTYIHRNPREINSIRGNEASYEWSSYQDHIGENRFGELLDTALVLEQFDSPKEYGAFVDSSVAKDEQYLFDPF